MGHWWNDSTYLRRVAKRKAEYSYRSGYDQALAFFIQSVDKYGLELAFARLKKLKPIIYRWRGRIKFEKRLIREEPPLSPSYRYSYPKLAKERKYLDEPRVPEENICPKCEETRIREESRKFGIELSDKPEPQI